MDVLEPIYVIGYPKSGNTWLARMIAEVLRANIASADVINSSDNRQDRDGKYLIIKKHYTLLNKPKEITGKSHIVYQ